MAPGRRGDGSAVTHLWDRTWPVVRVLIWAAAYFAMGRLGLYLASIGGVVAVIWPSSGFGFAAVWALGLPGVVAVALGDVAVSLSYDVPMSTVVLFALANTTAAWLGVSLTRWATRRLTGVGDFMASARGVLVFGVVGAGFVGSVSAIIGQFGLAMMREIPGGQTWRVLQAWALGDAAGVLVVAPVTLVWLLPAMRGEIGVRWPRTIALFVVVTTLGAWMFSRSYAEVTGVYAGALFFLPLMVLAGLVLSRQALVSLVTITAMIAYWGTRAGRGPFAAYDLADSLLLLQVFLVIMAWSTLLVHGLATELCAAQADLRRRVEERTHELAAANRRLRDEIREREAAERARRGLEERLARAQKMEMIGTLAGGVAHDLNNILTSVLAYPDLILLKVAEDSPLRKPIEMIRHAGQQAAAIVQDLLTLARRGVREESVLALDRVVEHYSRSAQHRTMCDYHLDVEIRTDLEPGSVNVRGSAAHLEKALANLVSNAAEACPDGGHVVISTRTVSLEEPRQGYETIPAGDWVVLSVSDDGLGMSHDEAQRIFEPFYTKKALGRSGTGLGMAVVWGTVKDHGGHIDLESAPGQGTTLALYLPLCREEAEVDTQPDAEAFGGDETVLVVDDIPAQCEVAKAILEPLGYQVETVSSGEAAVDRVAAGERPDLVVLDMIMDPGIDGLETYRQLLRHLPELPVVLASGYSETERVRAALAAGRGHYLKKPYTVTGLARAVRNVFDGSDSGRTVACSAPDGRARD